MERPSLVLIEQLRRRVRRVVEVDPPLAALELYVD
jgi:hypothetical protein